MSVLSLACALLALPAAPARAVTLVKNRTASGVDWESAGVGGIPVMVERASLVEDGP